MLDRKVLEEFLDSELGNWEWVRGRLKGEKQ